MSSYTSNIVQTREPHCLVFIDYDGKTAVAMDWKGREEFKSTDHAKVLEEAPKIHPRVVIDGELILDKPVKFSGYNRLEIIGTPRVKILYYALKIRDYIATTNWWGTGSSWIVVLYFTNVKHVLVEGLYFEMLDWNEWFASGRPGGTTIMATTQEGNVVRFYVKNCIIIGFPIRAVQCDRWPGSTLPEVFVVEDCYIRQPELPHGGFHICNPYGCKYVYIRRNYLAGNGVPLSITGQYVFIEKNTIEYVDDTYIQVAPNPIMGTNVYSVVVRSNVMGCPTQGTSPAPIHIFGNKDLGVENVIIEDNIVYGDPSTGTYPGSICVGDYVKNAVVKRNVLNYAGGIVVKWSHHESAVIESNIVKNVQTAGYSIRSEAGITYIVNNIVDSNKPIHFWFTNVIIRNNIGFEIGKYVYVSDAVPIGKSDVYGDPVLWTSQKNRFGLVSLPPKLYVNGCPIRFIKISVSGVNTTAGEVITVKLVATKADGSQNVLEKSFSSDQTYYLTDEELLQLMQGNYPVTAIEAYAKTNQASTSASVYVTVGVD